MLKSTIFFGLLALCTAATIKGKNYGIGEPSEKEFVPILKSVAEKKADGSFIFSYEGGDGSFREEVGIVKNAGTDEEFIEVFGTYRYYDSDGDLVEVKYTADKDGFVPEGTNIPKEISLAARAAGDVARSTPVEVKK